MSRRLRWGSFVLLVLVSGVILALGLAGGGRAGLIPGGGSPRTDCFVEFDVQGVTDESNHVICTDGDPCDTDGQCDGVCTFRVRLCVNQTNMPECRPANFRKPPHGSFPLTSPSVQNGDSACGAFTDIAVKTKKGKAGRKRLQTRAISKRKPKQDRDILFLTCLPRQGPCPTPGSTTTTTVRGSTTTTRLSTTTTTTMATGSIQCCLRSSATGAFTSCMVLSGAQCTAQCTAQGGISAGAGTCSPNPCPPSSTTTSVVSSTTTTTAAGAIRCCVQSSATGAFDRCIAVSATQCSAQNGIDIGPGACPATSHSGQTRGGVGVNPCPPSTTTTTPGATTTTVQGSTTTTVQGSTTTTVQGSTTTTVAGGTTTTAPAATTTTTAGATTTTTMPAGFTTLSFTTTVGTSNCGGAGLNPAATAPFSGQLFSDTAETTPLTGGELGLGCLYIGGGNATNVPPDRIPDASASILGVSGGTLSGNAGTGRADCTLGLSTTASHCISEVNTGAACTSDANCEIAAPGSCAPDANCFFGPPLPIPNAGLSTCVLNVIKTNASGTVDTATGSSSVSLPLVSRVYLTGNATSPCPKCTSGTCKGGANNGGACTPVGTVGTSLDCPPTPGQFLAPLDVDLTPLTSGKADKTAADGNFCPSQANAGAFGKTDARAVVETGSPAGNLSDGMPHAGVLASVFCIPMTGNIAIDIAADLPGPGAIGLNGNARLQ